MNQRRQSPFQRIKTPAYQQVFERLDAALEENTKVDNYERIRRMRAAYFADVDALEKSGTVILPP
jgi:hypothetical protein